MATIPVNFAASAYNAASKIGGAGGGEAPSLGNVAGGSPSEQSKGPSFGDMVGQALSNARDVGYKSEMLSAKGVQNQAQIHEMVTAVANAELTLQTVVAIRDKMINAYQDILKMPI